jgi:formate dehydrogenase assembly factor FdhD
MNAASKAIQIEIDKRERELAALRAALATLSGSTAGGRAKAPAGTRRKRKPLTAAQKKAISQAMKAAWKKRKTSDKKTAE